MGTIHHLLALFEFQPNWPSVLGGLGLLFFLFILYELWRHALMVEHTDSRFWHVLITLMVVLPSIVAFAIMVYADIKNQHPWHNFGIVVAIVVLRNIAATFPRLVRSDWEGMPMGFSSMWLLLMLLVTIAMEFIY